LIKVSGYNALGPLPFTLRVETDTSSAPPAGCDPRVLSGGVRTRCRTRTSRRT
jgi:hypothetical protein